MDAADAGDVEGGRRILAELETVHPRWRDAARSSARHPETPPLGEILGE